MKKQITLFLLFLTGAACLRVIAQPNIPGYVDPALNHNRLLREQMGEGTYKLIGTYKVTGSSYLFGPRHKGDLFAQEAMAYNIQLSYDTYNQLIEFYSSSNPDKPLVKEPGTVDSFTLHADPATGLEENQHFVYGRLIGAKDKAYFQVIYAGPRFSIYKKYRSELGYVSENYVQSELRQFDLNFDYWYANREKNEFRKIKPNATAVVKEFSSVKDLSKVAVADDFFSNPNAAMQKVFLYLNQ